MKILNVLRREVRYARAAFHFDKRLLPPPDFEKKLIGQLRQHFKKSAAFFALTLLGVFCPRIKRTGTHV